MNQFIAMLTARETDRQTVRQKVKQIVIPSVCQLNQLMYGGQLTSWSVDQTVLFSL